jgi:hypothetical protein
MKREILDEFHKLVINARNGRGELEDAIILLENVSNKMGTHDPEKEKLGKSIVRLKKALQHKNNGTKATGTVFDTFVFVGEDLKE